MSPPKKSIVLVDEVYLKDFDGTDATLQSQDDIKAKAQSIATAALPTIVGRAIEIVKASKNERNVIEAMKFLKTLSDGEVKAKQIEGAVKKFSNDELLNALEGEIEDVE